MTEMTRLGVFGSEGRMGQRIIACAEEKIDIEVVFTADV
jgi:dihydrodipicolinate reductase